MSTATSRSVPLAPACPACMVTPLMLPPAPAIAASSFAYAVAEKG